MTAEDAQDLHLRAWTPDDLGLMERLLGDPAMTEHLGGPETPAQLRRRLDRYVALGGDAGRMYVVTLGPDEDAVGSVGFWPEEWHDEAIWETGWSVVPALQGRGIASRATAACVSIAAAVDGPRSLHAFPAVDNTASNGVCRRVGFALLGEADIEYPKGRWMRANDWALDLDAWAAATARWEVVGTRVALGPLRPELFALHTTWVNDPEVGWNVFGGPQARSDAEERAWLERESAVPGNRFFLVYRRDAYRPIGVTSLTEVDPDAGTATFRILLGSPRDRGQGFGSEASALVLDHGFRVLGLREIRLRVFGYNEAGLRLYRRLGFREVDRRPMKVGRDGVRWDSIRMTLPVEALRRG